MDDAVHESSVFYNPTVARISDTVIDVSFALSSVLFSLMLWLIFRHSRKMGKYRWYMLVNVLLCYASDMLLTLVKPVFLGPVIGWYLQGFVPANASTSTLLVFVLFCVLNAMEFSIVSSLLYRFAQSYFGRIRDFFEGAKPLVTYVVIAIGSVGYLSPIVWVRFESNDAMRQYAANYSNLLIPMTRRNGFYVVERTVMTEIFLYFVVNNLFLCVILCGGLHLVFLRRLRSERFIRTQSKTNVRLQMMLFRTITFQLALALVLLAFPSLVGLLITALSVPHSGAITTLLFTAVSLHASAEFLGICYFVAPYRRAILAAQIPQETMLEVLRWLKRFDLDGKQITTRRLRSLVENNQMPLREVAEVDYEGNVLTPDPQKMNMFTIYLEEDGPAEVEFRIATVTDVEMAVAYLSSCFVATFTVFAHHGVPPKCAVIAAPKLISELIFRFCDFLDDGERDTLTETLNGTWQIDDKRLESLRLRGCNDIKVYRNQEGDQDENFRVTEEGILRYCLTRDDHLPVPEASRNSQLECNVVLRLEKLRFDVSVLDVGVRPFRSSEYDESAGTDVRNVRYNIADHGNGVRLLIHFKSEDGEEWEVVVRHGKKDEDEFFDEYWY